MSAPTILLVDDDEVLRQVLRRVLTRQGLNVLEAGDLAQARHILATQACQVGLFDLCLPDGDGVELAKDIQESGSTMPLLLMTAYPLRLREQPDLAEKFTRVLSKPVNLQELREAIDSALAGAAAHTPAATAPATATVAASAPPPTPPALPPPQPVATPALALPSIPARAGGFLRPVLFVAGALAVGAFAVYFFFPESHKLLNWGQAQAAENGPRLETVLSANPVAGDPDGIELSKEVVEQMKIKTAEVKKAGAHRPLQLAGSLALDPDKLARVRALFPGQVVEIATFTEPNPVEGTVRRPIRFGDPVAENQLLAVVYSKDLGEKKSELIDALSQLDLDKDSLDSIEKLYERGGTTEVVVRQARRNVTADLITVSRAERTLRTWQLPEKEIDEVKQEAQRVIARQGERDKEKEKDWARVEIRSRIAGTVVEKNLAVGDLVDTTGDLFKVADMSRMKVWANASEEDLPVLESLKDKLRWTVHFTTDPDIKPAEGKVEAISPLIDPTQHTAIVMGWVDNAERRLRSGEFVTATIELPPPTDTAAIPTTALVDDGSDSIVFVQPDPKKAQYHLKRVVVAKRFSDQVFIKSALTVEESKKGYAPLVPGEDRVVTQSALEMKAALDDLKAKAKP